MEFQLTFVILTLCSTIRGFRCGIVQGPFDVTALYGADSQLSCRTEENDLPGWAEIISDSKVQVFVGYDRQNLQEEKYDNFNISGTIPVYNLDVKSIEIEDEGIYECAVTLIDGKSATLSVEVPAGNITLTCGAQSVNCPVPGEGATPEVRCTCTATGAYPNTLDFDWTGIESPGTSPTITPTVNGLKDSFDYKQEAIGSISSTSGIITCTLKSYRLIEAERSETYEYSSPVCELSVEYDETCTGGTANLTCSCSGDVPKVNKYTFLDETSNIIDGDTDVNIRRNVPMNSDKETTFYCSGCNGFNVGDQSLSMMKICNSGRTTLSSKPYTMRDGGTTAVKSITPEANADCSNSSSTALIVICCVEGVVIVAMVFVMVFLYSTKKAWKKEDAQCFAIQLKDTTEKASSAYMDLQHTNNTSPNFVNIDVPYENLNLLDLLPGKGFIIYRRAQMISTHKRTEILVKTVSEDSPARLATLQADEVRMLLALSSNVNIVQFLGRCNKVPNLLCYEFVNGTKLGNYLKENYQPSKIHQYGNTKQKRYYVAEKGSLENLPGIALQISRGMKYLTAQKFLHPGLRSEKIIIDVSGQCKLYDFVSTDNAKDIMAILWDKTVPYQWMSPEYLFLEKLDPSADVWSFGVVLWEIFSHGATPYDGKARSDVERGIREKKYLSMPNNCPGAIWQMILNCWEQSPEKRPPFDHLYLQLSHMCYDNKEYDEIHST